MNAVKGLNERPYLDITGTLSSLATRAAVQHSLVILINKETKTFLQRKTEPHVLTET